MFRTPQSIARGWLKPQLVFALERRLRLLKNTLSLDPVVPSQQNISEILRLSAAKAEAVTPQLRMKRRRTVYFVEEIRAPASAWQALTVSLLVGFEG